MGFSIAFHGFCVFFHGVSWCFLGFHGFSRIQNPPLLGSGRPPEASTRCQRLDKPLGRASSPHFEDYLVPSSMSLLLLRPSHLQGELAASKSPKQIDHFVKEKLPRCTSNNSQCTSRWLSWEATGCGKRVSCRWQVFCI